MTILGAIFFNQGFSKISGNLPQQEEIPLDKLDIQSVFTEIFILFGHEFRNYHFFVFIVFFLLYIFTVLCMQR